MVLGRWAERGSTLGVTVLLSLEGKGKQRKKTRDSKMGEGVTWPDFLFCFNYFIGLKYMQKCARIISN